MYIENILNLQTFWTVYIFTVILRILFKVYYDADENKYWTIVRIMMY